VDAEKAAAAKERSMFGGVFGKVALPLMTPFVCTRSFCGVCTFIATGIDLRGEGGTGRVWRWAAASGVF
jgi:hypothetical protein